MNKNLENLKRALEDCDTSTEYVVVIRKITRTQDPDAIKILASLLDSPGPVGAAAVQGLISFGQFAESSLNGRLPDGSCWNLDLAPRPPFRRAPPQLRQPRPQRIGHLLRRQRPRPLRIFAC
jgi:hypothetical protein